MRAMPGSTIAEFVLDASVTAAWCLSDEGHPIADAALTLLESGRAIVPSLWRWEVLNLLLSAERRGRVEPAEATATLYDLSRLPIETDHACVDEAVLALARQYGLSSYDAAYLEIAQRRRLALATLDKKLNAAASAASLPPLSSLASVLGPGPGAR